MPTDTLLIPIPEVDDFPTDDALRFGKLRPTVRSFAAFGLVAGFLNPKMENQFVISRYSFDTSDT
jgi:hypothetical protein